MWHSDEISGKPRDGRNVTAMKYLKLLGAEGFEKRPLTEFGATREASDRGAAPALHSA
jgi:hypothetical protein